MAEHTEKPASSTPDEVMSRFARLQRLFWLITSSAFCAMSLLKVVNIVHGPDFHWGGDTSGISLLFVPTLESLWYAVGIWLSMTPERRQLFILHVALSALWIIFLAERFAA